MDPEGNAGLSVLGSALLAVPSVFTHLFFGSLSRHKRLSLSILLGTGQDRQAGNDKVGSPAWTITFSNILAHL